MIRDIKAADIKGLDVYGAFSSCGFQASNVGRAIDIIGKMKEEKATVFLTFTSNLVASGLRGVIAEMCRKKLVDCIITAGGSLDHDLIKSRLGYLEGDFMMDDGALHRKGINRLGNILVPNKCYEYLEGFMQEVYEDIYKEEKARGAAYALASPSQIARRIGQRTGKDSFLHWCAINDIPVFCPGITDSAIGLQTYFYKQKRKDFGIDVTKDMNSLAQLALNADSTGGIVLGRRDIEAPRHRSQPAAGRLRLRGVCHDSIPMGRIAQRRQDERGDILGQDKGEGQPCHRGCRCDDRFPADHRAVPEMKKRTRSICPEGVSCRILSFR